MLLAPGSGPAIGDYPRRRDLHRSRPPPARATSRRTRPGARGAARPRARAHRRHGAHPAATAPTRPCPTTAASPSGAPGRAGTATSSSPPPGANPLADQSTDKFAPLGRRAAPLHPHRSDERLPVRLRQTAQLFDSPAAPDLCVIHSAAHNWEDQGGHLGEHGSLGHRAGPGPVGHRRQGRAAARRGPARRAPRRRRAHDRRAARLRRARRRRHATSRSRTAKSRLDVLDLVRSGRSTWSASSSTARTPTSSTTWRAAARRRTSPASSRWAPRSGTARWRRCRPSRSRTTRRSSPARIPGHHGILNNAWFDRATGEQVITNSQATWPHGDEDLTPGIESIHDAVHRTWPDAFTASVNEPCDIGADYSTFDFFRRGEVPPIPKDPFGLPAHHRALRAAVEGLLVVVGRRPHGRRAGARHLERPLPRRELPGAAVHVVQLHAHRRRDARRRPALGDGGGVVRDSDGRVGEVLDALERRGAFDDSAFVLVADHGMEESDPAVPRRLGRRTSAKPGSRSATRRTASSTSERPDAAAPAERVRRRAHSRSARVVAARRVPGRRRGRQRQGLRPRHVHGRGRQREPRRHATTRKVPDGLPDQRRCRCPRTASSSATVYGKTSRPTASTRSRTRWRGQNGRAIGTRRTATGSSRRTSPSELPARPAARDGGFTTFDATSRAGTSRCVSGNGDDARAAGTVDPGDDARDARATTLGRARRARQRAPRARPRRPRPRPRPTAIPLRSATRLTGVVADVPEAQAVGRRGRAGRAAVAARGGSPMIVAGPALADADVHHRADDRAHHLPAERVGADLVAQHAVAEVEPPRLEHPPRRRLTSPGPLRQNDEKSCSPTNGSAASRSAARSSGSRPTTRSGRGTGRARAGSRSCTGTQRHVAPSGARRTPARRARATAPRSRARASR